MIYKYENQAWLYYRWISGYVFAYVSYDNSTSKVYKYVKYEPRLRMLF